MTFGNTESMLPKLDEDPVDTQEVIPQYNDAVKNPKHQSLRFLGYFAAGFLVFVVVFLLTSLGILYYFHTDFKKFITNKENLGKQLPLPYPRRSRLFSVTKPQQSFSQIKEHMYPNTIPK